MAEVTQPSDQPERDRATDTTRSVIVKAPAGSGKTALLVTRYLKLLARVERPEAVLAITFTRKAALEMRHRVLEQLDHDTALRERARAWDLDNRPDRLKIQTIDSFSLQLANAMPMASGVSSTRPTDNPLPLYEEAVDRILLKVVHDDPLASTVADFIAALDNDVASARRFLIDALARRDQWQSIVIDIASAVDRVRQSIRRGIASLRSSVETGFETLLEASLHSDVVAVVDGHDDPGTGPLWASAARVLLTKNGQPRKRFSPRDGFPAGQAELRQRAARTSAQLDEQDLARPLSRVARLPEFAEQRALEPIAIVLSLALVELADVFRRHSLSDFTELTVRANQALGIDDLPSELALALDYRIQHLLVDEFQDTSIAQFRLLTKLVEGWTPGDGNTFFAVGDPMQSIYRFRDAEVRLYLETFRSGLPHQPLAGVELRANFRTASSLVDWVNTRCAEIFDQREDTIVGAVPFTPAEPAVEDTGSANVEIVIGESASHVAMRIEAIRTSDPDGSIAVLVRSRTSLGPILAALRVAGIRYRGTDIESLSETPVVRDLYALTRVLYDPGDRLAALALLRSPLVGLTSREIERANEALAGGVALKDLDLDLGADDRRLERVREAIAARPRSTPARTRVEETWFSLGGSQAYPSVAGAERFLGLLDDSPELIDRPAELARRLDNLMNAADDSADKPADRPADSPAVDVMTIHRSKGLEFDHVVLPALEATTRETSRPMLLWRAEGDEFLIACKESNPRNPLYEWLVDEERDKDRNETKRMIYVALTRAKKSLSLIGELEQRDTPPPRGSMLELLWPAIANDVAFVEPTVHVVAPEPAQTRLPLDYQWRPPARPTIEPPPHDPVAGPTDSSLLEQWVRREFASITRTQTIAPIEQRRRIWRLWERETLDRQTNTLDALERQRQATLTSSVGRTLLLDAQWGREFVAGLIVIDRVLDGLDVHFDTAEFIDQTPVEARIDDCIGRYHTTLRDAGVVASCRFGIFFTALGRLVEVAI